MLNASWAVGPQGESSFVRKQRFVHPFDWRATMPAGVGEAAESRGGTLAYGKLLH